VVEHFLGKEEVVGSNPMGSSSPSRAAAGQSERSIAGAEEKYVTAHGGNVDDQRKLHIRVDGGMDQKR
jgi:hypothetical protein